MTKPERLFRFNPYQKFTGREFQPYALATGQGSLAWNYLHEELGAAFFWLTTHGGSDGLAVWYSTNFDRPRREMLKAALTYALEKTPHLSTLPVKADVMLELMWVLGETEKLEDARNTIIHAPLALFGETDADFGFMLGISADTSKGNPRAERLSRKFALSELRWFRDTATVLGLYVHRLLWNWQLEAPSLPDRPKLPNRENKNNRQGRSRRQTGGLHQRPP